LVQHARSVGDGAVLEDVIAQCDRYAKFLLTHFHKEEEFNWPETSFYDWVKERHPVGNLWLRGGRLDALT